MLKKIVNNLALAALMAVAAIPLATVVVELIRGGGGATRGMMPFAEPDAWRVFVSGVVVAACAAAVASAAGASLALAGTPRKGRWLVLLALGPLAAPPTVYGLAWNALWPAPKLAYLAPIRCAMAMAFAFAPLAALVVLGALRLRDPAARETARLAGMSPWRRFRFVELPSVGGPLAAAAAVVFILGLSQFEIPAALNYSSFPEAIYSRYTSDNSTGAPAALAFLAAAPALAMAVYCWRFMGRFRASAALAGQTSRAPHGGALSWALWLAFVLAALAAPMAALAWRAHGAPAFGEILQDFADGVRDTLPRVTTAALCCLILGWILAGLAGERRPSGLAALGLAFLPAAIAPAVLGIGIIRFWSQPVFGGLVYGQSAAWMLALMARYLAVPLVVILAGRRMLGAEFLESARLAPVAERYQQTRLLAPALASPLAASAALCLVLMLGELGATTLLSAPGVELLSFRLHSRIHTNPPDQIAAFGFLHGGASLILCAAFCLAGEWALGARRKREG